MIDVKIICENHGDWKQIVERTTATLSVYLDQDLCERCGPFAYRHGDEMGPLCLVNGDTHIYGYHRLRKRASRSVLINQMPG